MKAHTSRSVLLFCAVYHTVGYTLGYTCREDKAAFMRLKESLVSAKEAKQQAELIATDNGSSPEERRTATKLVAQLAENIDTFVETGQAMESPSMTV